MSLLRVVSKAALPQHMYSPDREPPGETEKRIKKVLFICTNCPYTSEIKE